MSVKIALIVAVAENGVIGRDNDMPWRLSSDLKRFKALTMGKPIVMGRKTFQSIGKALAGRTNIVVTRDPLFSAADAETATSIEAALVLAKDVASDSGADEIMIIGGATIYEQVMEFADLLYVTHVHASPDGDTRFPDISEDAWECLEMTAMERGAKDSADTSFAIYRRRAPSKT